MDMPTDEAMRKGFNGIHQEISGDCLNYIFDKFWIITFKPLPFFIGSDSFIGDGLATELILADVRLDVGQLPARWERDKEYAAAPGELNTVRGGVAVHLDTLRFFYLQAFQ